jgi:hypothetical protein
LLFKGQEVPKSNFLFFFDIEENCWIQGVWRGEVGPLACGLPRPNYLKASPAFPKLEGRRVVHVFFCIRATSYALKVVSNLIRDMVLYTLTRDYQVASNIF